MSDALPVMRVVTARGIGDCGIACLAMMLGKSYEDVFAAAVAHTHDKIVHKHGMWVSQIMRVAKEMGVTLHRRKKWDLESSVGILGMTNRNTEEGHVVVLKEGYIIDVDGTIWAADVYFKNTAYVPECILTLD